MATSASCKTNMRLTINKPQRRRLSVVNVVKIVKSNLVTPATNNFPYLRRNSITPTPALPVELTDFYIKVIMWASKDGKSLKATTNEQRSEPEPTIKQRWVKLVPFLELSDKLNQRKEEHVKGTSFTIPSTLDADSTAMMINLALNTHNDWSWEVVHIVCSRSLLVRKVGCRSLFIPELKTVD